MRSYSHLWRRLAPLVLLTSLMVATAPAQRVWAWGDNGVGQLNIPPSAQSNAKQIDAGYYFSLVLTPAGGVLACGDNSYGELNIPVAAQSGVSTIAAGVLHTLALKNGGVIAWGSNERGETNVPVAAQSGVTAVSAGEYYSIALKNGGVIGWGNNDYGVLNIPVEAQSGVTAISSGSYHSLALKNGGVIGWGMDVAGSLQIPDAAKSGVVAMAAGYLHSLALKSDGSVVAWGWNSRGQCDVPVAAQSGVVAIEAGYDFSMALKSDGSLVMWGDNDYGWLNIPANSAPMVGIAAAAYHTVGLQAAAWATLDQTELFSGDTAQGTANLAFPAGAGGVRVYLTSDTSTVHVPAYVDIAEGATTGTFTVTTDAAFGAESNAKIQTVYGSTATVAAVLKVKGTPANLTFNRTTVVGGSTVRATATLSINAAQPTNTTFDLSSSDSSHLSAPATITIPAGQTSATVPLTHNFVSGPTTQTVAIDVSFGGSLVTSTTLDVLPFRASVTLESPTIYSGYYTFAFVTLNAPTKTAITVDIDACDPDVSMPDSVTINAGSRTAFFPVVTYPSPVTYTYPVTVTVNGNSFYANLRILAVPSVRAVTLTSSIIGNTKVVGNVRLNRAAGPGGEEVYLCASGGLTVPDSVIVPEGMTSVDFDVIAPDVSASTPAQVKAESTLNEFVKDTTILPLTPASLVLSSSTVASGGTFTGTVTLRGVVAVDTEVQLASANALVTVPSTVTVLAGHSSATFTGNAGTPRASKGVKITATKNGKGQAATITVLP